MSAPDPHVQVTTVDAPEVTYLDARRRAERDRSAARTESWGTELGRRLADGDARRVADPHLGHPLPVQLRDHHEVLRDRVHAEIRRGATVHRRLPVAVRQIPWVVALLDAAVLFTFCAAIFNVALDHPFTLQGAVAAMLALLGSGIAYAWFALTGHRLRCYRTELGEVAWRLTGRLTRVMLGVAGAVVLALAVLMAVRVVGDAGAAADAGYLPRAAVTLLGVVFAVVSAAANLSVIAVHALDGSEPARELRHAGRLLRRYELARERARRRAWRRIRRHRVMSG